MNSIKRNLLVIFGILFFSFTVLADTLVLKDGKVLQGTLKSATAETLQFEVDGKIQNVMLSDITSLTFSPREAKPAAPPAAATATATTAPTPGPGTIPAGAKLMLKTNETISTHTHKKGAKVTAVLDNDLVANGTLVVAKGTLVYGTVLESVGGRVLGGAQILMTFNELSINNQLFPIVTDDVGAASDPGGAAKAVGAGALIGGAAGSSGTGAAVGGAVAIMHSRKNHVQVPAGTLAEVSLKQPLTIK